MVCNVIVGSSATTSIDVAGCDAGFTLDVTQAVIHKVDNATFLVDEAGRATGQISFENTAPPRGDNLNPCILRAESEAIRFPSTVCSSLRVLVTAEQMRAWNSLVRVDLDETYVTFSGGTNEKLDPTVTFGGPPGEDTAAGGIISEILSETRTTVGAVLFVLVLFGLIAALIAVFKRAGKKVAKQ